MNPIQHLRIYKSTKTLMSLCDGISYFYGKKQIFIIDSFSDNVSISEVFHMDKLYTLLRDTYQIHIFDKHNLHFKIQILYGIPESCVDLTSIFYNNKIFIPKDTNFKQYHNIDGKLYIIFTINGIQLQQVFDRLDNDYTYEDEFAEVCFNRDPTFNYTLQEAIYSSIVFNEELVIKAKLKYNTTLVNCLHIKIDDVIQPISISQNIPPHVVKEFLENSCIVFEQKGSNSKQEPAIDVGKLYSKIGELEMEKDFLKKF